MVMDIAERIAVINSKARAYQTDRLFYYALLTNARQC